MTPSKTDILKEDMALLQEKLEWLQQNVPANDTWQNVSHWESAKIQHDILDYILTKGGKDKV